MGPLWLDPSGGDRADGLGNGSVRKVAERIRRGGQLPRRFEPAGAGVGVDPQRSRHDEKAGQKDKPDRRWPERVHSRTAV
jgi:hypothetical protein